MKKIDFIIKNFQAKAFIQDLKNEIGEGYYIYPNGTTYEGGYKDDVFHGKGKFIDPMGKILEGNFKNGKFVK